MWYEKIIEDLSGPQIINDSKTPSGRVHIGSLRGVLIHDALYRALKNKGVEVTYKFGIDDFDPLDGLPSDAEPWLKDHMGHPLCNIPAPTGSQATDLANHYIAEFLEIFPELGVGADVYRMRDIYRSGQFNAAIDIILRNSHIVRKIYAEISNAIKPDNWHPFQVVCERCGKIGTTEATAYDGKEVTYKCRKDAVSWASGCEYEGKISPFNGNGKLPWKLEWAAKWHTFGITIEGAGKDHCTKGGSRDVAVRCLEKIFGQSAPLNVPYEFFLVSGAKMSSSKGIGTAAREIANFLPPEILRFLMIRTPPKKTVNFSTDFDYIVKLFNEHDRLVELSLTGRASPLQQNLLQMIEVNPKDTAYHPVGFQLLTALLQLPHIDVKEQIEKRTESTFSKQDKENLQMRLKAARYWLENYASNEDRMELQRKLPVSVGTLSATQRAFLNLLGRNFPDNTLDEERYQTYIFDTARMTPIDQKSAFLALYRVLFDKDHGPKGGSLLYYLDKDFLVKRFLEVSYSRDRFWNESGITVSQCEEWFRNHHEKITSVKTAIFINVLIPNQESPDHKRYIRGKGVIELKISLLDGKTYMLRVLLIDFEGEVIDLDTESNYLKTYGKDFLDQLANSFKVDFGLIGEISLFEEYTNKPIRFPSVAGSSIDH